MTEPHLTPPAALDRLAAHLRGGGTVLSGLRDLAADSGPLAADLAEVALHVDAGATLGDALAQWRARRPDALEAGVMAAALEVAHKVGGQVAAPLEGLAAALADRADVAREVLAQSAQARLSAVVVGLAPVGVLGLSLLGDTQVVGALVGTTPGRGCLLAGLALEGLAVAWMRRILRRANP